MLFATVQIGALKIKMSHLKYCFSLLSDFATLKVTDTQLDSRAADLYFQLVSPTPLSVRANNMIHAETGSVTPIQRDVLDLWTDGQLEDVILSVLKGKPSQKHAFISLTP